MRVQNQSISDRIYNEIRDCITKRQYLPGQHLVEADLIKTFVCSRATMRGVLHRLVDDGLVEHFPNKGILVRRLSLKEMLDIQYIVQALEVLSARLAAESHDAQDIRAMGEIIDNYARHIDGHDPKGASKWAVRLRMYLAGVSKNEYLLKLINQYYTILTTNSGSTFEWDHSHYENACWFLSAYRETLLAIEQGNADLAAKLTYNQMQHGIDMIKSDPSSFV